MVISLEDNSNSLSKDEKLNQRRSKPAPLEINTTKTNAFFNTTSDNLNTPRPPPSLSRKISIRQQPEPPITPTSSIPPITPITKDAEDDLFHYDSYANRLRNLVASRLQESSAPSPIPQHISPSHKKSSLSSSIHYEDLQSLPTPCTISAPSSSFSFPTPKTDPSSEIPTISINYPKVGNDQPKPTPLILAEQPALGEDYLIPSAILEPVTENDIIGKQIGDFRVSQLLGVGAFSKVYLAQHVTSGKLFALKSIHKLKLFDEPRVRSSIDREVAILKHIHHPNIVHLEATMETEKMLWIVLEYVEGGELFDAVKIMHHQLRVTEAPVNETQVKYLFLQVLHAVQWLHDHNIVHRDLKLENILIHKNEKNEDVLKITDFGLARVIDPENPLLITRCGSEEYASPEVVQQQSYDGRKSDTWSLGVILYALLVGYLPFRYDPRKQERVSQLFYRIVRAEIKWPKDTPISDDAKFVVQSILERNPEKRIDIHDIEKLAWFNK